MFFPQLMNIKSSDLVLEIGPGAYPYWRSDCLADVFDENSEVDLKQFGGMELNTKGKPLFKIVNNKLPFKDDSFDYVICSHVFEHVPLPDLPKLAQEIMRVSKKAYIEFPRPAYDYIYNFDVHLSLMDIVNGEIVCIGKENTNIMYSKMFQKYSMNLRDSSIFAVDSHFSSVVAVGAEFNNNIPITILANENEFWDRIHNNIFYGDRPALPWMIWNKIRWKRIWKQIIGEKSPEYFKDLLLSNE